LNELIVNGCEPIITAALSKVISEKPKSKDELRRSYQEILSKDLIDIIHIIKGNNITVEQFLYDQILSISKELQLRKKNLNITETNKNNSSHRIIKEDLINDWLTSFFNHKHSDIGLSCHDQKRGGQSSSNKNPGEFDFFICDKNNEGISIMEAFRLFSNDTTIINKHLNKIAGYDQQCLSPVFVISYCDVNDFSMLCENYKNYVFSTEYNGYTKSEDLLVTKHDTESIKAYQEVRYRSNKSITFFHFLVNLRFNESESF